jgi:hypothetical protein
VSFTFLPENDSEEKQDPHGWEYHPPRLRGKALLPEYPVRPLAARFGSAVVVVQIAVGQNGEISAVSPRPGSTPGPFAGDFLQAVETAVQKWSFTRPEWWFLGEGKDINGDGKPDYQNVISISPTTATGDVEFRFEIVGDKGSVSSATKVTSG